MNPSARLASLIIFLFFLFFNGLQVYLILERVSEGKTKFGAACTSALLSTLSDYNKLNAIDSASAPTHAWIAYATKKIEMSRTDSQTVRLNAPFSSLATDTVEPAFVETMLNSAAFRTIDLKAFDSIFQKALSSKEINARYRLDTITLTGKRQDRQMLPQIWARKRRKEYGYSTNPLRIPYNATISIFAQVKNDPDFVRKDLLWPMLSFALILLIGNTALVFVYKTIRKQKRINEVKTDFINNMTHEMKTPITIASAGLEALEHRLAPDERSRFYLHTTKKQLFLLNDFVERILEGAVQDLSQFNLKKEKVDLHALLEELVQSYSLLDGKRVNFQLIAEGPVWILADRLHLQTALHNIVDNAVKYSKDPVDIRIELVENSRECIMKIVDNGIGIPPQYLKNIFEKFFRVPQGDGQSIKGFGLGLYYVNSIIKKHSGNITVHSKQHSGTEFIITLPKNI